MGFDFHVRPTVTVAPYMSSAAVAVPVSIPADACLQQALRRAPDAAAVAVCRVLVRPVVQGPPAPRTPAAAAQAGAVVLQGSGSTGCATQ